MSVCIESKVSINKRMRLIKYFRCFNGQSLKSWQILLLSLVMPLWQSVRKQARRQVGGGTKTRSSLLKANSRPFNQSTMCVSFLIHILLGAVTKWTITIIIKSDTTIRWRFTIHFRALYLRFLFNKTPSDLMSCRLMCGTRKNSYHWSDTGFVTQTTYTLLNWKTSKFSFQNASKCSLHAICLQMLPSTVCTRKSNSLGELIFHLMLLLCL